MQKSSPTSIIKGFLTIGLVLLGSSAGRCQSAGHPAKLADFGQIRPAIGKTIKTPRRLKKPDSNKRNSPPSSPANCASILERAQLEELSKDDLKTLATQCH